MDQFYLIIVGLLFCLAIFDLVVGVSNDAVNFLNSAIGSKAAKWKTIMIIASIGILLGAMTSGGMMEVARKGIFNPEHFYFSEIMLLFLAVMVTDVILLDLFNTFGMPTSTTVSIVFEILGASFALSVIKVIKGDYPLNYLFNQNDTSSGIVGFMNWSKAGEIVSGILISVVVAFTVGAIVMFVARFFFSFRYFRKLKVIGSIFSGIALTAISYFLIFKGMGSVVKDVDIDKMNAFQANFKVFYDLVAGNISVFLLISFVVYGVAMYVLQRYKVNPLKIVVLFGTFSLAMAFAGNDLVNFIGVPIASWQSFNIWRESGEAADVLLMTGLSGKVATPYFILMGSGVVMIFTLWFSKKARSVSETELKLGAQSEIEERFNPNLLARAIVDASTVINKKISKALPNSFLKPLNQRFAPVIRENEEDAAHFDLVRAAVNLVSASVLIAVATDLKLPLSTTYVSFMVAMGTSLSDRAWGRESAVYRVAGVMSVIAGWFLTAVVASSAAAIFVTIIYFFGYYGIGALIAFVIFSIYKTSKHHTSKLEKEKLSEEKILVKYRDVNDSLELLKKNVNDSLGEIKATLKLTSLGIAKEDKKILDEANEKLDNLNQEYAMVKSGLFKIIKKNKSEKTTSSHLYLLTYDLMQDILQSLGLIVKATTTHVKNNHKPLAKEQWKSLSTIRKLFEEYIDFLRSVISSGKFTDESLRGIRIRKNKFLQEIDEATSLQIHGIMNKKYGFKNTSLYFTMLMEMKDLVAVAARFVKLYSRVYKNGKLTKK